MYVINPFTGQFDATESGTSAGDVQGPASSTDNAVTRFDGVTGKIIKNSNLILDNAGSLTFANGQGVQTGTTALNTVFLSAYDVDGAAYQVIFSMEAGNNPSATLNYTDIGTIQPAVGAFTTATATELVVTGPSTFNGAQIIKQTTPGAYPYDVLVTDYLVLVDTSVARTIRLPNAPTSGQTFIIKDSTGTAAANNISLTTVGGVVTIDGATTQTMTANWQSLTVVFTASNNYRIL